jgi:hypothetical protein
MVNQDPDIRVLLDVGAQMLDLQNRELAKAWLELDTSADAAVYFNDKDELTVLTKDGIVEAFISSSYRQQLDKCVVYLDDAHTRGTDLKLPRDYRAAVTLGAKVTKDRLVQGNRIFFCGIIQADNLCRLYENEATWEWAITDVFCAI